jgi:uncharacterized membrane protein YwaF
MWIQNTLFILFALALSVLGVTHVVATTFFLYWTYPWFDIPMHVLGGVVVALGFLTLFSRYVRGKCKKGLLLTFAVVLTVGILWEIFEFVNRLRGPELDYAQDTTVDLAMDIIGGFMGYCVARASMKLSAPS